MFPFEANEAKRLSNNNYNYNNNMFLKTNDDLIRAAINNKHELIIDMNNYIGKNTNYYNTYVDKFIKFFQARGFIVVLENNNVIINW